MNTKRKEQEQEPYEHEEVAIVDITYVKPANDRYIEQSMPSMCCRRAQNKEWDFNL